MAHSPALPSRPGCLLTRAPLLFLLAFPMILGPLVGGCGGGTGSTPDAGPPPVDQCISASDIGIMANIAATTDGGIPDGGVADGGPYPTSYIDAFGLYMQDHCTGQDKPCFPNILNETGVDACLTECFMGTEAEGISLGCANCYVELIQCGADHCITMCLGGNTPECEACVRDFCTPRLHACAGLPLIPAP